MGQVCVMLCVAAQLLLVSDCSQTDDGSARAAGACSCTNKSLCQPLNTPHPSRETFVAMVHDRTIPHLNYSIPSTLFIGEPATLPISDVICAAHAAGVRVVTAVGVNGGLLGSFSAADTASATARKAWAHRVVHGNGSDPSVVGAGLDGILVDIEHFEGNSTNLTMLISELATELKAWHALSQLSFALSVFPQSQAKFYDHRAISRLVDYILVMAYDEFPFEDFPHSTAIAGANSDLRALGRAVEAYSSIGVSPNKLVIGLPWYGNDFLCSDASPGPGPPTSGSSPCTVVPHSRTPIKERAVLDQLKRFHDTPPPVRRDNASVSLVFDYQCTNQSRECPSGQPNTDAKHGRHQVWFDNADTLREKYQACDALGVLGVGVYAADFVDYTIAQGSDNWAALASVWPRGAK